MLVCVVTSWPGVPVGRPAGGDALRGRVESQARQSSHTVLARLAPPPISSQQTFVRDIIQNKFHGLVGSSVSQKSL